ncbi:arginase family protein [uncultured Croceitalea sp.]|uniref:arginase family protein n=1 Tax=uncultured Croceitalea sp. TaxID=1798908 RepID=UPI003306550E
MKIYFPQWQGSGTGSIIESGAKTVLDYLNDEAFVHVPLSKEPAGKIGEQQYHINNYKAILEQLGRLKSVIEAANPNTIQTIGGDCGLEIVPVSYLNKKYPNMGVVWFDAHADINKPSDSGSHNFHGMPLRTLLGEANSKMESLLSSTIFAAQIHYVGLRDIDEAEQQRITSGSIYAPQKTNIPELVQTLKQKQIEQLYLHFDFDCLEPSDYSKTYYQVPGGVSIATAEACIRALQQEFSIVGSSVLESVTTHVDELQPIQGILDLLLV